MDDFDCLGVFYLINKQKLHKPKSFRVSGYRAAHKIHDNYLTTATHHYLENDVIYAGEKAVTAVIFMTPEVYPNILWVGREIEVYEGNILIGILTISEVINQELLTTPACFKPVWIP